MSMIVMAVLFCSLFSTLMVLTACIASKRAIAALSPSPVEANQTFYPTGKSAPASFATSSLTTLREK